MAAWLRESSIDLQFPNLTPLFFPWRNAIEAKGIPPHVSLLYPWRTPLLAGGDIDEVGAAVANCSSFPITFRASAASRGSACSTCRCSAVLASVHRSGRVQRFIDAAYGTYTVCTTEE